MLGNQFYCNRLFCSNTYGIFDLNFPAFKEYLKSKQQREEALQRYKQKKLETFQMLSKKTKKGQPNLNLQMEYLLQKIQGPGKWNLVVPKIGLFAGEVCLLPGLRTITLLSHFASNTITLLVHKGALQARERCNPVSITSQFKINKCVQVDILKQPLNGLFLCGVHSAFTTGPIKQTSLKEFSFQSFTFIIRKHKQWNDFLMEQNFLRLCCCVCVWGGGAKALGCFLLTSHGCRMTSNVLICKARLSKQRVRSDLCRFTVEERLQCFVPPAFYRVRHFHFFLLYRFKTLKAFFSFYCNLKFKKYAHFACGNARSQWTLERTWFFYHRFPGGLMI